MSFITMSSVSALVLPGWAGLGHQDTTNRTRKVTLCPPLPVATSSKAAPPHKIHLNYVSRHATDAIEKRTPNALFDDLITAFEAGTQIDYEIVIPLTGRHVRRPSDRSVSASAPSCVPIASVCLW